MKCFLLTVTNFILSSVSFIVFFYLCFFFSRARGFILHYFTFLPSSRNISPVFFYYYLLAFFKLCCRCDSVFYFFRFCFFFSFSLNSRLVFQLGVKFRMPFSCMFITFPFIYYRIGSLQPKLVLVLAAAVPSAIRYHLFLSFLVFVFFILWSDMCAYENKKLVFSRARQPSYRKPIPFRPDFIWGARNHPVCVCSVHCAVCN